MKRLRQILAAATLLAALGAAPAQAEFGLGEFDVRFADKDKSPATQAGSHPYSMTTFFMVNHTEEEPGSFFVDGGDVKDLIIEQIRGFVGDADAVPRCSTLDFATNDGGFPKCPAGTAVGLTAVLLEKPQGGFPVIAPIYNLTPPPGVPVRIGFVASEVPLVIDVVVKQSPNHNVTANTLNIPQPLTVFGSVFQLWGVPGDPSHDFARAKCVSSAFASPIIVDGELNLKEGGKTCPSDAPIEPWLTLPRACSGPLATSFKLDPWDDPGAWVYGSVLTHDQEGFPQGFEGCGKLLFGPDVKSEATTDSAETGTGLDFELEFVDEIDGTGEGLIEADGIAQSDLKDARITLPEGVTVNPSIAEGLGVCTPADLERETVSTPYGQGCPNSAKIGTVQVQTPLVPEPIDGSVYLAQQDDPATSQAGAENPFDSLLAFYIVLKHPGLGVLFEIPAEVEPDPRTGQLVTTVTDAPQWPFTRFKFHFREGQRAPLITPPACGTYTTTAELTPWARPSEVVKETASFQITRGVGGGPCPPGGLPPFAPGLVAGTLSNAAGAFSPFNLRLTRNDGEQEFTRFSIKLPPGIAGILAGIPKCSEAAIATAKHRSGTEELASPSCPAASELGSTLAGAGVGSALAYAPGKIYLAGPYEGAPISIVAITAAVVGPFDIGTVVVRQGFKIDPRTAEVFLDPIGSDPIPHIIDGIVVHARDIRAYVDRPNFVFNPTSCEPTSTASTLLGSGLDFVSPADDNPVVVSSPFQAADCAALKFKPRLSLRLLGGTKRGGHPKFRAFLRMPKGNANISNARVTLPSSAFLDQSHIRTVCTRVQFAQKACPAGSVYGYAKALTPVLDAPIEGPVYLRSSENKLPDLVAALRSQEGIEFELVGRIDSLKGRIRNTFDIVPDAPVSSFTLTMQGGKKGLITNSTDLCKGKHRAIAEFDAHNGKAKDFRPVVKAKCGKKAAKRGKQGKRSGKR